MKLIALSSLSKVFNDEKPTDSGFKSLSMLLNERRSFQVAFQNKANDSITFSIDSELKGFIKAYLVKCIPSKLAAYPDHDDYVLRNGESGLYPDLLCPIKENTPFSAAEGWNSVWLEIVPDESVKPAKYIVKVNIQVGELKAEEEVEVNIIDKLLPAQELIFTNWFHSDCLATYYGVEVLSERHWEIIESFVKTAVEHGLNLLLTPIFTPPLDTAVGGERPTVQLVDVYRKGYKYSFDFTKLKRWIEMADRNGVKYFEISHLFTQWGAKHAPKIMGCFKGEYVKLFGWETKAESQGYRNFLRQFAEAFNKFVAENNLKDRIFIHVSDEPHMRDLVHYRRAAKLIKEIFPDYRTLDALSDYEFYKKGLVETPVPAENHIEPFVGKVPRLWTYYCCGQYKNYVPNRFFAMPSQRNEILGFLLYKYSCEGFLQWGYNFWYSQYSIREINPFTESDAGGAFPSGDAYVVYPAPDGTPYTSLRLKVFYDGLQDLRLLKLLEKKIGRDEVIKVLEKGLAAPLSFTDYPRSDEWLLNKREEIIRML
ncbi:MAG TPA: DUF4091 domain-containing protein [Clostridiales bacterium]|nr:DUF4091 domain-containing protein [Clostridiales bacterium]HXK83411.1 DUF4091 domain-containing protein [Clostridiales bacterium]